MFNSKEEEIKECKKKVSFPKEVPYIFITCPGLDLFLIADKYRDREKEESISVWTKSSHSY